MVENSNIKNVVLSNPMIINTGTHSNYIGGLIDLVNDTEIGNCCVEDGFVSFADTLSSTTLTYLYCGSIVGDLSCRSKMTDCINTIAVSNMNSCNAYTGLGGLVGTIFSSEDYNTLNNCVNTGTVSDSKEDGHYHGGIFGYAYDMKVSGANNNWLAFFF